MFAPFGDLPSEGGFLDVEEGGDVGVVHVEEVSHEYGFNGLLVELFSSVKDGDAGTGDDGWGGASGGLFGRFDEDGLASFEFAVAADAGVGGDLVEPGRVFGAAVERFDVAGHGEQRVLDGFFGVERVGQESSGLRHDQRFGCLEQVIKRVLVAGPCTYCQFLDIHIHHSSQSTSDLRRGEWGPRPTSRVSTGQPETADSVGSIRAGPAGGTGAVLVSWGPNPWSNHGPSRT